LSWRDAAGLGRRAPGLFRDGVRLDLERVEQRAFGSG
jgi:hypothetical protein